MPIGAVWILLMFCTVVVAVGRWCMVCGDQELVVLGVDPDELVAWTYLSLLSGKVVWPLLRQPEADLCVGFFLFDTIQG